MRIDNPTFNPTTLAATASYAVTASYALNAAGASSGNTKSITKITNNAKGGIFFIADNRLYSIKGTDTGTNVDFEQAALTSTAGTPLLAGIQNAYEIAFPGESGSLTDAGTYGHSAYALFDNGNLYTWGNNEYGNLGLGNTTFTPFPTLVTNDVAEVYNHPSTGGGSTTTGNYSKLLVRKTDGKVYGCGYNAHYELGLGNTTNQTSLTELTWIGTNPISVWNIGTYGGMIMAQLSDGSIKVAGDNTLSGRLGVGSTSAVTTGTTENNWITPDGDSVDTTFRIISIYAGERYYTTTWQNENNIVVLLNNGTTSMVKGAGWNTHGTLGDGSTTQRTVPTEPNNTVGLTDITTLVGRGGAAGTIHILKSDGTIYGWGYNGEGQLGDGTQNNRTTPTSVKISTTSITDVTALYDDGPGFPTYGYRCSGPIIKRPSGYYSWGRNDYGQAGTIDTSNNVLSPSLMNLPGDFELQHIGKTITTTATEGRIKVLVGTDNSIWAFGYNNQNMLYTESSDDIHFPVSFKPPILIK